MSTNEIPVKLYAKLLVLDEAGRVLVLRRSATHPKKAGKWDLPGGLVNTAKGERPLSAARRETREETGLEVGTIYAISSVTEFHEAVVPSTMGACGRTDKHPAHVYRRRIDSWRFGTIEPCEGCEGVKGESATYCMGIIGIGRTHASMPIPRLSSEHDSYQWLGANMLEPAEWETPRLVATEILDSLAPKYRVLVLSAMGCTEPSKQLVAS